jgi:hypothetical protein
MSEKRCLHLAQSHLRRSELLVYSSQRAEVTYQSHRGVPEIYVRLLRALAGVIAYRRANASLESLSNQQKRIKTEKSLTCGPIGRAEASAVIKNDSSNRCSYLLVFSPG